nr:hypothetical protein NeseNPV-TR_ORF66 [Neodiprion sertifer nucleopolyhedrovirus]
MNELWVCGGNIAGQLGSKINKSKKFIKVFDLIDIVKVCCGGLHTICLDVYGNVFTFGCNDENALGRVICDIDEHIPVKLDLPYKVIDISAGDSHSVFLYNNGSVAACGLIRVCAIVWA